MSPVHVTCNIDIKEHKIMHWASVGLLYWRYLNMFTTSLTLKATKVVFTKSVNDPVKVK